MLPSVPSVAEVPPSKSKTLGAQTAAGRTVIEQFSVPGYAVLVFDGDGVVEGAGHRRRAGDDSRRGDGKSGGKSGSREGVGCTRAAGADQGGRSDRRRTGWR